VCLTGTPYFLLKGVAIPFRTYGFRTGWFLEYNWVHMSEEARGEVISDSWFKVTFEILDDPADYEKKGTSGVQVRLTGNAIPPEVDGWTKSSNGGLVNTYGLHQACQSQFWGEVIGTRGLMQFVNKTESAVNVVDKISGATYQIPYQRIKDFFTGGKQSYDPKEISGLLRNVSEEA